MPLGRFYLIVVPSTNWLPLAPRVSRRPDDLQVFRPIVSRAINMVQMQGSVAVIREDDDVEKVAGIQLGALFSRKCHVASWTKL